MAKKTAFFYFYHVLGIIQPIRKDQSDQAAYHFFFPIEFSFKVFPAKMNDVTIF